MPTYLKLVLVCILCVVLITGIVIVAKWVFQGN